MVHLAQHLHLPTLSPPLFCLQQRLLIFCQSISMQIVTGIKICKQRVSSNYTSLLQLLEPSINDSDLSLPEKRTSMPFYQQSHALICRGGHGMVDRINW